MKHDQIDQFTAELNAPLPSMLTEAADQQTIDSEMDAFNAFAAEAGKF